MLQLFGRTDTLHPSIAMGFTWPDGSLDPQLSFAGPAGRTRINAAGALESVAANVPRLQWDPVTLAPRGLLLEMEERRNSIPNALATGAVAGVPGTLPTGWFVNQPTGINREVVGTGVESGIAYVDIRFSGTALSSGSFTIIASPLADITAASGQSWTGSAYVRTVNGSANNLTNIFTSVAGRTAGGSDTESTHVVYTPTTAPLITQRREVTRTLNSGSTARVTSTVFSCNVVTGAAVDITLRIGAPQLEQGVGATSFIPTSSGAVTRTAETCSFRVDLVSPITWFAEAEVAAAGSAAFPTLLSAGAGGDFGIVVFFAAQNRILANVGGGTYNQWMANVAVTRGNVFRAALAIAPNDARGAVNGVLGDQNTTVTPTVSAGATVVVGATPGGFNTWMGHIRRLGVWQGRRLSDAQLQSITAG